MIHAPSRRTFLKGIGAITASGLFPNILRAQDAKKIGIGVIGTSGKGESDASNSAKGNTVLGICDVDSKYLANSQKKYPDAKAFSDFRKMLDEIKGIEAVTVSTPDHMHFPAAMHAISLGKHVCVQKPLTNTLWENRQLHLAARKMKVITQMGNQGHTYEGNRVTTEWVKGGVIGKVKEVHVWTNRPIWPQGKSAVWKPGTKPDHLDWTQWLGQVPDMPYSDNVHPFKWRGFLEFGAGAFGDMGCHLMDAPFVALGLTVANAVTATQVDDLTDIAWPTGSIVKLEFNAVPTHGDVNFFWYEGKKPDGAPYLPPFSEEINLEEAFGVDKDGKPKVSPGGWMIVGTDGVIFNKADQAVNMQIWKKRQRVEDPKLAKTEPRSVKSGDPQAEWIEAIRQGKEYPWMAQFDYSCPLTEATLIGGLAMRFPGKRLVWDSAALKFTNHDDANKFVKRAKYRDGWEYSADKMKA